MKVRSARINNHKRTFEVRLPGRVLDYPFVRCRPEPGAGDAVVEARPNPEMAGEGFAYALASGRGGAVHVEEVLAHCRDAASLRGLLLYWLPLGAQRRVESCGLSRREIIRRLGTLPAQIYRLLDAINSRKSVGGMLRLLHALGCDVALVVSGRDRATGSRR
ncbi:MAG: hypothetical protein IPK64_05225 [bacterium]|nr:hypothetical protein [bacterium]